MPKGDDPIYELTEGFVCPLGSFYKGERFLASDPLVRKYPDKFRALILSSTVRPAQHPVERATAAPGEERE